MRCKNKTRGLVLFFMGVGMFIQMLMPFWGMIIAAGLVIVGFWLVFSR